MAGYQPMQRVMDGRCEPCHNTERPHITRLCSFEYYPFLSCIKFPIKFRPMFNIPKNIILKKQRISSLSLHRACTQNKSYPRTTKMNLSRQFVYIFSVRQRDDFRASVFTAPSKYTYATHFEHRRRMLITQSRAFLALLERKS